MEKIKINTHSSIRIANGGKIFYFDPYEVKGRYGDANYIFVTHDHYDHLDVHSISNVLRDETRYICPKTIAKTLASDVGIKDFAYVIPMEPGQKLKLEEGIEVEAIPAYNVGKPFHQKGFMWLGFVLTVTDKDSGEKISYYVAGDTDITEEAKAVKCDVAFVPIGGTYTMDYSDAAKLINIIKPKTAIPTHYGNVVGEFESGMKFAAKVDDGIDVELLIQKEEKVNGNCGSGCGGGCGSGCRY